jgi:hypothetical protein
MKTIKAAIFGIIALLSVSCLKMNKNEYYIRMTSAVEIGIAQVPDTVDNNAAALITARAQAYDACWSNLTFLLTKNSDFEYSLQAFGLYESYGNCPQAIIYGDTTITFQPTQIGLYKFHIYKGPNNIETDTMIVRGNY